MTYETESKMIKRLLAFLIDYFIIVIYAAFLFGLTVLVHNIFKFNFQRPSAFLSQAIGFVTMTVPVFLYFYLSEKSNHRGTIGKRLLRIYTKTNTEQSNKSILLRNLIKFLPWEIAHTGVQWAVFYSSQNIEPPVWVWIALILPQLFVIIYVLSIIISKGKTSIYDKIAGTSVINEHSKDLRNYVNQQKGLVI